MRTARRTGFKTRELRPNVHVKPGEVQPGRISDPLAEAAGLLDRDSELGRLETSRDVRMAPGVDFRIDSQGHARAGAVGDRDAIDSKEFACRLDVDCPHAQTDRQLELVVRLANPSEDDL